MYASDAVAEFQKASTNDHASDSGPVIAGHERICATFVSQG